MANAKATIARTENTPAKPRPTSHNKMRNTQCMGVEEGGDSDFEAGILCESGGVRNYKNAA
ncbi:hypothetical protein [Rhodoferax sp. TH121]|uniref:hypothetical protein n=1 Tax=Rhodoferax sp. TH121 TaxID=2022803 RepID=UPI0020CC0800|nr:hypothetical protein [Rhodoferax sp. TH121]